MKYLLDTNVLSELRKGARGAPSVRAWFDGVDTRELHVSVLTLGEVRRGVESIQRRDPEGGAALSHWLLGLIATFEHRIVPVDQAIADRWGRLNVPDPLPAIDGLLGATALVREMTVVTRNVRDVGRTGAQCVDPFGPR